MPSRRFASSPHIALQFVQDHADSLCRILFRHPLVSHELISFRGATPGPEHTFGCSFTWSKALKALAYLVVKARYEHLAGRSSTTYIEGGRGSVAASLDYALGKQPAWLLDIFGIDSNGKSLAHRFLRRLNPEMKRAGPVTVYLVLDPRFITVAIGDFITSSPKDLETLLFSFYPDRNAEQLPENKDIAQSSAPVFASSSALSPSRSIGMLLASLPHHDDGCPSEVLNLYCENQVNELWEHDRVAYEGYALPAERLLAWWSSYPLGLKGFFAAGKLVGTLSLWPISESDFKGLTDGRLHEAEINPVSITRSPHLPTSFWYIGGVFFVEEFQDKQRFRAYIRQAFDSWYDDRNFSFPIHVAALGSTSLGSSLLIRLGFRLAVSSAAMPDEFPLFTKTLHSYDELLHWLRPFSVQSRPAGKAL